MNMKGKELRLAFGCLLIFCASYSCAFDQSDYSLVKKLGGGFHGNTWLLKNETYNTTYVLKEIKSEADNLSAQREIYFGEKLSIAESPIGKDNVGRFIEYLDVENRVQLIFIFEGAPLEGLLYQLNVKEQTFEPTDWLTWLRNTTEGRQLLGVKFCHDNGVIHRDINPANIVICFEKTNGSCGVVEPLHTDNMHLRLIDFGSAVDDYARRYLYGPNGPTWAEQNIFSMPPEAIIDHGWQRYSLSTKYDSWCVGYTILAFILGSPDVFSPSVSALSELLIDDHLDDHLDYSTMSMAGMAEQCIGLPEAVVVEKMYRLPTCTDNGYADYIRNRDSLHLGFIDIELLKLVRLLLEADPDLRIGVDEALRHPYFAVSTQIGLYYYAIALAFVMTIGMVCYRVKQHNKKKAEENKRTKAV